MCSDDPAVEAARRAFCVLWPDQGDPEFNFLGRQRDWAILAAREVLIVAWPGLLSRRLSKMRRWLA